MEGEHILALGIFGGYLLTIVVLLCLILFDSIPRQSKTTTPTARRPALVLFALLALASALHTWYYMFKFLSHSYRAFLHSHPLLLPLALHLRLAHWLARTPLFLTAWAAVSSTPRAWWWSEQICLYTAGPWALFVWVEGRRRRVRWLWAYPVLGQLMAVSVASSLFFLALLSAPPPVRPRPRVPPTVYFPLLASMLTAVYSPYLLPVAFLPNLLIMHALIIVPFIPLPSALSPSVTSSISPSALLTLTEPLAFLPHFLTTLTLPSHDPHKLFLTMYAHPAQSSISWDVIYICLGLAAWAGVTRKRGLWTGLYTLGAVAGAGPGGLAGWVLNKSGPAGEVEPAREVVKLD